MTTRRPYRVIEGSATEKFRASRAKVRLKGGGFGNGKTTDLVILALEIAKEYPGCTIMLGRATYPKLNSSLRKEFFKWMPPHWKKSFNKNDNELEMVNGTVVHFRYIAQGGKSEEATTSNLLSNTYDFIGVDQVEDPEITHKDFLDLLGRLRGNAEYAGDDPTMPKSGPRWIALTCNPTRNWVYRKLVKPLHDHRKGLMNADLLCLREGGEKSRMILDADKKPQPIIDVFESSTYENAPNLEADFIQTLEAAYSGQMRDRFLLGKWSAYEGLVYPKYDNTVHVLSHKQMLSYYQKLRSEGLLPVIREGYDDGIAVQCCYIFAFEDDYGNIFFMDGFYEAGISPEDAASRIHTTRTEYRASPQPGDEDLIVRADPALFRRTRGDKRVVGKTVAQLFEEEGVVMTRGNNDRLNGIIKVRAYLEPLKFHRHPITGNNGSPRLFISDKLTWWDEEITDYFWKKNSSGEPLDEARDGKDHAMDVTRYILTEARLMPAHVKVKGEPLPKHITNWSERDVRSEDDPRSQRHRSVVM